jgi:hypothetical protein
MDRNLVDIFFTEGVINPGGGALLVAATSPTSNSVTIAAGRGVIQGDDEANQGKYLCVNEGVLNLICSAAPVSDSRYDLVYLRVNDPVAGGPAGDNAEILVLEGTPAGSPVVPTTPTTAIPLARILRTSGDTAITSGMITDMRPTSAQQTFTVDSNFEILTAAQIALLTPYAGQTVYNSTSNVVQYYDGSTWVSIQSRPVDDRDQIIAVSVFA